MAILNRLGGLAKCEQLHEEIIKKPAGDSDRLLTTSLDQLLEAAGVSTLREIQAEYVNDRIMAPPCQIGVPD